MSFMPACYATGRRWGAVKTIKELERGIIEAKNEVANCEARHREIATKRAELDFDGLDDEFDEEE